MNTPTYNKPPAYKKINTPHTIQRWKANWIDHISGRNCLLKHVIEVKFQGTGRRGGRHKQMTTRKREDTGN